MYYFKFVIPKLASGETVSYSPGYPGELTFPPKYSEMEVLIYNDADQYGIARTESEKILKCAERGECKIVSEDDALNEIEALTRAFPDIDPQAENISRVEQETRKVWHGEVLERRWNQSNEEKAEELARIIAEQVAEIERSMGWHDPETPSVGKKYIRIWCDKCGYSSVYDFTLPAGATFKTLTLKATCPKGHPVQVTINSNGEVVDGD